MKYDDFNGRLINCDLQPIDVEQPSRNRWRIAQKVTINIFWFVIKHSGSLAQLFDL